MLERKIAIGGRTHFFLLSNDIEIIMEMSQVTLLNHKTYSVKYLLTFSYFESSEFVSIIIDVIFQEIKLDIFHFMWLSKYRGLRN